MAKGYLFIKVDEADAEKFADEIQKNLTNPWKRALDWEARLRRVGGILERPYERIAERRKVHDHGAAAS